MTEAMTQTGPIVDKLAVIGVGLIGGSFALALKHAGAVRKVVGVGRSLENLSQAQSRGAIDEIEQDAAKAVRDADLVFIAAPVGSTGAILREIAAALPPKALVTDAGSTKQNVIEGARAALGQGVSRFVPAH